MIDATVAFCILFLENRLFICTWLERSIWPYYFIFNLMHWLDGEIEGDVNHKIQVRWLDGSMFRVELVIW